MSAVYTVGSDLPDLAVSWLDDAGDLIDFSTGWTFSLKIARAAHGANVLAQPKTSGITGSATAPNVVIVWADGELDSLASGGHVLQIEATKGGKKRYMQAPLEIKPRIS